MKHNTHSAGSVLRLLLTLVVVALILPPFARAARLSRDEPSAVIQGGAAEAVTVEDFGAAGDGVHDDSEAIENALNSGAASTPPTALTVRKWACSLRTGRFPNRPWTPIRTTC